MTKSILYCDMDGVVADFMKFIYQLCPDIDNKEIYDDDTRHKLVDQLCADNRHVFDVLEPMENGKSIEIVKELSNYYDIYFLSTPMWHVEESYMHKRIWLERYFGDIAYQKLILSHRKDLLMGEFLIDDRIKHGVDKFMGEHIHYGTDKFPNWEVIKEYLIGRAKNQELAFNLARKSQQNLSKVFSNYKDK